MATSIYSFSFAIFLNQHSEWSLWGAAALVGKPRLERLQVSGWAPSHPQSQLRIGSFQTDGGLKQGCAHPKGGNAPEGEEAKLPFNSSFLIYPTAWEIDLFQTDGGVRILGRMETGASEGVPIFGEEECLKERKWWCFLLSSIFTFLLGIFSVLLVRLLQAAFCKEVSFIRSNQFISDSR